MHIFLPRRHSPYFLINVAHPCVMPAKKLTGNSLLYDKSVINTVTALAAERKSILVLQLLHRFVLSNKDKPVPELGQCSYASLIWCYLFFDYSVLVVCCSSIQPASGARKQKTANKWWPSYHLRFRWHCNAVQQWRLLATNKRRAAHDYTWK